MQYISELHSKFALRPHRVWKYGRQLDICELSLFCTVVCTLPTHTHTHTLGVSLGHSRDLMTIAQVSYHVTASVHAAPATNCVASVILPGVLELSFYRVCSASHYYTTHGAVGCLALRCTASSDHSILYLVSNLK